MRGVWFRYLQYVLSQFTGLYFTILTVPGRSYSHVIILSPFIYDRIFIYSILIIQFLYKALFSPVLPVSRIFCITGIIIFIILFYVKPTVFCPVLGISWVIIGMISMFPCVTASSNASLPISRCIFVLLNTAAAVRRGATAEDESDQLFVDDVLECVGEAQRRF